MLETRRDSGWFQKERHPSLKDRRRTPLFFCRVCGYILAFHSQAAWVEL